MIATAHTPITSLNRLNRKIRQAAPQPQSLKVKASDVDSYGDYNVEQISELPANPAGMYSNTGIPDVSAEEFESIYHWFLS